MDWIRKEPSMPQQDVNIFKYDDRPNDTRVLKLLLKAGNPTSIVDRNPANDQDWVDVLEKHCLSKGAFEELRVSKLGHPQKSPMVSKYLGEDSHYAFSAWLNSSCRKSDVCSTIFEYRFNNGFKTCNQWEDDLALSITYFPEQNFSYSIFYGCNKSIQNNIASRLKNSENVLAHPLLLPGIFVEEERRRQMVLVRDKLLTLTKATASLNDQRFNWANMNIIEAEDGQEHGAVDPWLDTYELKTGLENWREQLEKMIAQCDFLEQNYFQPLAPQSTGPATTNSAEEFRITMIKSGRRVKERLEDIVRDYNEHIRKCEMIMEGMTLATQMAHTRANMEIAVRTKSDSSQMRSIALLTMVFLPATFVATFFSMGFFQWQPDKGQAVVSTKIWIYAVVAGVLTILTVASWFFFIVGRLHVKRKAYNEKVNYDEFDD